MEYEVIDVSKHNGKITNTAINDFKGSGITAAILFGYLAALLSKPKSK